MKKTSQKGFTLIELMVVILIIAVLGALGIVSYGQANRSARDGKRQADMESVRQALLLRRQEIQCLPNSGYSSLSTSLVPTYLSVLPSDPGSNAYVYTSSGGVSGCRTSATLGFTLEGSGAQTITIP